MSFDHEDDYSTRRRAWVEANEPEPSFDEGRTLERWNVSVDYEFQDDGRTLKLWLEGE